VACAFGLSGSNAFHILATHFIPAAEANLVSYLWPVEVIGLGVIIGLFVLTSRQVLGLILRFTGAVILIRGGATTLSLTGIALAFISGLSWAAYCIFRLRWKGSVQNALSRSCLLSAISCAGLHFVLEPTVIPSAGALASSAAIGLIPLALGNYVWDEGFRRGDSQLLAILAYATPLVSALFLVELGMEVFTLSLAAGATLIVLAGYLARADS
jgi:drug/metabolite transporter (DMT)-like permease